MIFLKWGQKSKSRVIIPPLKETGSAQLESLTPDCTGSDAILFILILVSSEGSSWPPAVGPFSAGVMACTRLWDPQLTFEGWREGPQSGLVTPQSPLLLLGLVEQAHSSLCPGLRLQHNLEAVLSWGSFIWDDFLLRVKVRSVFWCSKNSRYHQNGHQQKIYKW